MNATSNFLTAKLVIKMDDKQHLPLAISKSSGPTKPLKNNNSSHMTINKVTTNHVTDTNESRDTLQERN